MTRLDAEPGRLTAGFVTGTPEIRSMGTLIFGPEGILFIGDSRSAAVFAVDLGERTPRSSHGALDVKAIDQKIAGLLGRKREDTRIHDLAVDRRSQVAYLSVSSGVQNSRGRRYWNANLTSDATILLRVMPEGQIGEVSFENVRFSKLGIDNAPDLKAKFSRSGLSKRTLTIRDMAFIGDKLYISGLSNEEFSSAMRVAPFPFQEDVATASVGFFHGSHGQYETSSPVNTFLNHKAENEDHLIAAYSCTPLISIPVKDLIADTNVRAKTIAELGAGSHPIDMITFDKEGKEYILIANSRRGLIRIDPGDIARQKKGVTKWSGIAGVPYKTLIEGEGIEQLDNYNETSVLVLQRASDGTLDLQSLPTHSL
jgi:hypothetical protein